MGRKTHQAEDGEHSSHTLKMKNPELGEIIDIQAIQSLMEDFYKLVNIPIGLHDLKGNVLVGVGWQDICTKFHRVHPQTCKHCIESNINLCTFVSPGEFKLYRCKNNMWDVATPIMVEGQQVGSVFAGQFFFDDEPLDYELFQSQARRYGFNEDEYLEALEKVPRLSREALNTVMAFFMTFANVISHLSYSNIKLARSLAERDVLVDTLRKGEEKYRSIVETANEGIWRIDTKGRTTYANQKMAEMLGYSQEEIIGRSVLGLIGEEDEAIIKLNREKRQQGIDESSELKFRCKDGSFLWALVNTKSFFDKDGKFTGCLCMLTDITTRKKMEEALKKAYDNLENLVEERTMQLEKAYKSLKESQERLAEAQRIAHIGNWEWEVATNKAYWSEEMYRIFKLDPQEPAPGINEFLNHIHPDDRGCIDKIINKRSEGFLDGIDYRIILADGEERTVYTQAEAVLNKKCFPIRVKGIVQDITERKKSEEKIQRLANIVESSNDAISTVSLDGIITSWNKGAEQTYGYSAKEILGRSISIIEPHGLKGETEQLSERIKQGENVHSYETSRLRKNCTIVDVSISLSPVFDIHGKPTAISVIARDITESKRAEEKLRESEEKYRNIIETTNEGIVVIDAELRITYVNKKLIEKGGFRHEEVIGRQWWDFTDEEGKAVAQMHMDKRRRGVDETYELKLMRKDGSPFWVLVSSKSLHDKDGKFAGSLSMLTDITERKKAEEKIENLANIVESSNDAIITESPDGIITSWNKGAEQVYGYLAEEALGKNISMLEPDSLKGEIKQLVNEFKQGKKIQRHETSRLKKDGTTINVSVTLSSIFDQSGKFVAISSIAGDVTEKKIAEKLLQEKQMAEVANRTKNDFLAKMSHELRTPLNSIIGFSDMLYEQAYGELNEKQLRSVGNISKSGKHLLSLINNILDISKIEAGKMEIVYKNFELVTRLNMIRNILFPITNKKNIKIEIDIDGELTSICADEDKFVQIMYNVVDNAIKFSYENSLVKIRVRKKMDLVEITVEDTGIGIKVEDQYKLFRPFSQIYSFSSKKSQGTGLGLLLVKQIVHLHGGYVWFRSKPGEGSTFAFAIPINCKST